MWEQREQKIKSETIKTRLDKEINVEINLKVKKKKKRESDSMDTQREYEWETKGYFLLVKYWKPAHKKGYIKACHYRRLFIAPFSSGRLYGCSYV